MKLHIYIIIISLLIMAGCSKDLGNYNYQNINEISIDSVLNGEHHTGRVYKLVYGDSIVITPLVTGSVSGTDYSKLKFAWVINDDTVSNTKDFREIADWGFGKFYGNYYVTDLSTSAVTNYNFTVEILNDAARGTFILTEDEEGNSVLFTHSSIAANSDFRELRSFGGYELGKKPVSMGFIKKYGSSSTDYSYSFIPVSADAEYNVMQILATDMLPTLLLNKSSFVSPPPVFNITQYIRNPFASDLSYIVNNGKVHMSGKGVFSDVLYYQDPLDYDFGPDGLFPIGSLYSRYIAGWDYKNKRFRLFSTPDVGANDNYTKNYDNIVDPSLTAGQDFVAGTQCNTSAPYKFAMLTKEGNKLYAFIAKLLSYTSLESFDKVAELQVPNLDKLAKPIYHGGIDFWYLPIGRKIYRTSVSGLDLQLVAELPEDGSGDIVSINFDFNQASDYKKLAVATYNVSSAQPLKGSFYMLNLENGQIEENHLNVIYKVKKMEIGF